MSKNLLLLLVLLTSRCAFAQEFSLDRLEEVPVYTPLPDSQHTKVAMAYASSDIANPGVESAWQDRKVTRIDLVFTRYPAEFDQWIIGLEDLTQARLQALRQLDSALFAADVDWHFILQTDCPTRRAAQQLFHGFVVYHRAPTQLEKEVSTDVYTKLDYKIKEVAKIIYQEKKLEDSTALLIMGRHPEWKNLMVVMDWTGSMYEYGASVLLWTRLNLQRAAIKRFVFFNDGNDTPNDAKVVGETGGVYVLDENQIDTLLVTMNQVRSGGNGGDGPENDVEALLTATSAFDDFEELVLIADNRSDVRDLSLAGQLGRPVRVVLCGVDDEHPIHEDYLNLAYQTDGSVHTIESDLTQLRELKEGPPVVIENAYYILRNGKIYFRGLK